MCCQVSMEQWGENGVTVVPRIVLYGPVRRCRGVRETRLMVPHVLGCDGLNRLMVRTGTEGSEERGNIPKREILIWRLGKRAWIHPRNYD